MLTASLETLKSVSVVVRTYMHTYIHNICMCMYVNTAYLQCLLHSPNLRTCSVYMYVYYTYVHIIHYIHARTHYCGCTLGMHTDMLTFVVILVQSIHTSIHIICSCLC